MWNLSSLTRDQTQDPCIGRWILNHWTTREIPIAYFVILNTSMEMHLYVVDITVFKNKCPVLDYFSRTECLQRINLQRSSSHWTHDSFQPAVMAVISQFCLPASHVRLCNPMGCSAPGLPVHHQLLEFTQTHAHRAGDAIQPSHPLSSPSPAFNLSQHQGLVH